MNYSLLKRQLFIWLLICGVYSDVRADSYSDCNSCDWGCFNIQVQAGIAPVIWTQRNNFTEVSCNASLGCPNGIGPVVPLFEMPKFNKLYKLPWTVGGLIGYWVDDCNEVYVEGNYRQAKAKDNFTIAPTIALPLFSLQPQFVFSNLSKYKFYDFYVGARHYFDFCCSCFDLNLFIGGQVGVIHHKAVDFNLTVSSLTNTCNPPYTTGCLELFRKNTKFAGGANIGVDFCICDCLNLVLTAEFIATCGPTASKTNITFPGCAADVVLPELRPDAFIVGGIGNEIFFPITLGLNWSF